MKTVVAAEVKVEGLDKAGQSVGSFKKQLREAQNDVLTLSDKFGAASTQATNAAKRVAQLKDAIGDAKALTETFNPDKKFVALGGAIQGITAGFSTYQGLLGLVGENGKEVEQVLLKVQAAMALQQGISGIAGALDSFKLLKTELIGGVTKAFGTLRAAIISTGIGALAVGLGLVIANFQDIKEALLNLVPGLREFAEWVGGIIDKVKSWFGVTEDQIDSQKALADATKEVTDALKGQYEQIDRLNNIEKLRAKIAGKSDAEIAGIELNGIKRKKDTLDGLIKLAKEYGFSTTALDAERLKLSNEFEIKQLENQADAAEKGRAIDKANAEKQKAAREKYLKDLAEFGQSIASQKRDQAKKDEELYARMQKEQDQRDLAELERQQANERTRLENQQKLANLNVLNNPNDVNAKIEKIKADLAVELSTLAEGDLQKQILAKQAEDAITKIKKDAADEQLEIKKKQFENEIQLAENTSGILSKFADLAGKQTAAGKVLAIASATIDTYAAASKALNANYGIFGPAAQVARFASVAATIGLGIKNIKAIASVKTPGGGGGGTPNISATAPLAPQAQTTTLDQNSINQIGNASNRAFVLETDVTNNQERIRRLNRAARIN